MAKDPGLNELTEMLRDRRSHVELAQILQLELSPDRSVWRALCKVIPDGHEVVARMTWSAVGPSAGIYGPAQVGDIVILGMADGDEDTTFVIGRCSSQVDKIPQQVADGNTMVKALSGKKAYIGSDTKVLLGKAGDADADPSEPLVLGTELQTMLSAVLGALSTLASELATTNTNIAAHVHPAPATPPVTAALFTASAIIATTEKATLDSQQSSPVDDGKMNSDLVFTEKGS